MLLCLCFWPFDASSIGLWSGFSPYPCNIFGSIALIISIHTAAVTELRPTIFQSIAPMVHFCNNHSLHTPLLTHSPLAQEFNAITGLNGSGKSNILDSICFVLGITNLANVRAANLTELVYKSGQVRTAFVRDAPQRVISLLLIYRALGNMYSYSSIFLSRLC